MTIPTRPATDADLTFEYDGRPNKQCVSFFYGMQSIRFQGIGFRRPRKVKGQWVVRRYNDVPLLVRLDLKSSHFVAQP